MTSCISHSSSNPLYMVVACLYYPENDVYLLTKHFSLYERCIQTFCNSTVGYHKDSEKSENTVTPCHVY